MTDAKGKPVHGLKAVDFEVRHDGKPVLITNFSEIRGGAMPAASAETPVPPDTPARTGDEHGAGTAASRPPRRIVLFFDRLQIPDARLRGELFGSIRGFLEKSLGEGDETPRTPSGIRRPPAAAAAPPPSLCVCATAS